MQHKSQLDFFFTMSTYEITVCIIKMRYYLIESVYTFPEGKMLFKANLKS